MLGRVVWDAVLPAPPDHVHPGPGEDPPTPDPIDPEARLVAPGRRRRKDDRQGTQQVTGRGRRARSLRRLKSPRSPPRAGLEPPVMPHRHHDLSVTLSYVRRPGSHYDRPPLAWLRSVLPAAGHKRTGRRDLTGAWHRPNSGVSADRP